MYTTPDLAQNGIRAEYFNNIDFSGTPVATRTETKINYNWSGMAPEAGNLSTENYSIRWTATMCSPPPPATSCNWAAMTPTACT